MMCGFSTKTGLCVEKCLPKLRLSIKMGILVGTEVEKRVRVGKLFSIFVENMTLCREETFLRRRGCWRSGLRRRAAESSTDALRNGDSTSTDSERERHEAEFQAV